MTYEFQRESDDVIIEQKFPMGKCPEFIICDDGVRANRIFSVPFFTFKEGQEPSSHLRSMNEHMRKANIEAGERGRKEWKERMPKLRLE